jgi:hypothetical protein
MADGTARARRLAPALPLVLVLGAAAIRFRDFLAGGTLYRRDAGFFFVPWRTVLGRLLASGEWPAWNEWMSGGRPLAADPNASVFWPLSPLVVLVGPTGLALLNVLLVLVVFFFALRRLSVSPWGAAAGTLTLLFSGVFQSLPVFMTTCAAAAPRPFAFSRIPELASDEAQARGRGVAACAVAFGFSTLGGEPAITLLGATAFAVLAALAGRAGRPALNAVMALLLAAGIAAVQILPAAAELARSARGEAMRPEYGALFWSVRPSRLLTLLEPRLTGDPAAGPYWGSGTFDAGSPYFDDLALGVLPLLFAAAGSGDRRGRAAVLLATGAAVLSFGRFLPGFGLVAGAFSFVRYPEKWWVVATFALAAAAGIGVDRVFLGEAGEKEKERKVLLRTAWAMAVVCGALLSLCYGGKDFLRRVLWAVGLGAGDASGEAVANVLRTPLLATTATLVVCALAFSSAAAFQRAPALFTFKEKLRNPALLGFLVAALFLADASRRVAGTCPAGPPDLYRRETPDVALVKAQAAGGRFYDDGADDRATVERRTRVAGGIDLLRPETGVVFGLRYAGENDVDRMTPAASVRRAAALAALPWGEEKARALRSAGVAVVRTAAPGPDPAGTEEIGSSGGDRLVRISGARPEFTLLPEGEGGSVTVLERRASRARLRVAVTLPAAILWIGRTFDPAWRVRAGGREQTVRSADGRMAVDLPRGVYDVDLCYENPLFTPAAALSLASLAAALLLAFRGRP